MTEEQTENLVSTLESGHGGIEAFLTLPGDDRAMIVRMLEHRAGAEEIRRIVEQCEADGTMDKIRAFLANVTLEKNESRIATFHCDRAGTVGAQDIKTGSE